MIKGMSYDIPFFMSMVELLSPAGTYECAIAAFNAGADAVYLGLNRFGARANAVNLSNEELKSILDIAHINGRKVYLTVNTLFKDEECADLHDFLYEPYLYGLDGVIVQDVGVMSLIHMMYPDLPIHVSTQAAITSAKGCDVLKKAGVKRVVPARELSLREIKKLHEQSGLEIECFIHGSLCYSYSGKCLMSSFIGGRSGNRGRCAQPCRLSYDGKYPLSLKDLCVIEMLPKLCEAGISSLKIEGRMKSSAYVYGVTSIYRKYIDLYYSKAPYRVDPADLDKLLSLYTRSGNCKGYYSCHNSRNMITPDSPSYISNDEAVAESDSTSIPSIPVNIRCTVKAGKSAIIEVFNDFYSTVTDTGIIPAKSVNCELTEGSISKQLAKCGGTCFKVGNIYVDCDPGLFLPNGSLNEIRRRGLDDLRQTILKDHHRIYNGNESEAGKISDVSEHNAQRSEEPEVRVSVVSSEQLKAVCDSDASAVIIPMSLFIDCFEKNVSKFTAKKIYIALPYVVREEENINNSTFIAEFISDVIQKYDIAGFYVSNFESLAILNELSYEGEIISDIFLYAYNRYAYLYVKDCGVTQTTVPVELNERELIARNISAEELIIYGRLPMMITANCIMNTQNGCRREKNGHSMYLKDRKGEHLFVRCNCSECTNVIYNSVPICIADEEKLFDRIMPSSVRLSFTDEDKEKTAYILDTYLRNKKMNGSVPFKLTDRYTKGHIKRGVD